MFVYFVCCGPVRYIEDKEADACYSQKDNFVDVCKASTRIHMMPEDDFISNVSASIREAYPEHLNPFANDNTDVITDHQGAAVIGGIADYPEYLNPFSDDDEDDDDGNV